MYSSLITILEKKIYYTEKKYPKNFPSLSNLFPALRNIDLLFSILNIEAESRKSSRLPAFVDLIYIEMGKPSTVLCISVVFHIDAILRFLSLTR